MSGFWGGSKRFTHQKSQTPTLGKASMPHDHLGPCVRGMFFKSARVIARSHYSQIPPREMLPRCEINPTWAIMGNHGLFLTTDYNVWFLDVWQVTAEHAKGPVGMIYMRKWLGWLETRLAQITLNYRNIVVELVLIVQGNWSFLNITPR